MRRHDPSYPVATDYAGNVSAVEADAKNPLPKEGYTHISVNLPVTLTPQDAPESGVTPSDFNTRWAQHRFTMTLRAFGKWLTENVGPGAPKPVIQRDSAFSPYGRPIEYQGIARVRHNVSVPQPTTLGELVGPA